VHDRGNDLDLMFNWLLILSRTSVENKAQIRSLVNIPDTLKPLPEVRDGKLGDLPTLENLGLEDKGGNADPRSAFPFLGGESAAIDRINDYFWKSDNVAQYKETRNGLIGAVSLLGKQLPKFQLTMSLSQRPLPC